MFILSVLNQKGGVGKTTLATNLAAAAHLAGRRTLLLDLDRQGSAFDWFCARREGSPLDGLACARADKALSLPKIQELARGRDVVVCDGPPRLVELTLAAAVAADVVLVPMQPGGYDLWACEDTSALLRKADTVRELAGRPPAARLLVLNRAAPRTRAFAHVDDALRAQERAVCPVIVRSRVHFAETVPHGESVLTMFPDSPAAREIAALYALVVELVKADHGA